MFFCKHWSDLIFFNSSQRNVISLINVLHIQCIIHIIQWSLLTCKFWLQEAERCKASVEELKGGLGGAADPLLEWALRKFWHCGLTSEPDTCTKDTAELIKKKHKIVQGLKSVADMIPTCSWTITLEGTFWNFEEVQRALNGNGRDCALSASCSLQRLWISRSRRLFSLLKSCTRSSKEPGNA